MPSPEHEINVAPDNRLLYLIVSLVVCGGLALRFYGLGVTGIGGSDTILYYSLAERWLAGDFVFQISHSVQVFRPVLLAFNALALTVFGHTDYAIKIGNILVDGGSMILLARLAWMVSRQTLVVIACVVSYAFLPMAIWASRQELPHTLSTFLVLLTLVLYVHALLSRSGAARSMRLALAGLSLGAAAMTHEELVLLAIPLGLFLLANCEVGEDSRLVGAAMRIAAFSIVPLFAAVSVYAIETGNVEKALGKLFSAAGGGGVFYPEQAGRFLWNAVSGGTSAPFSLVAGLSLVAAGFLLFIRRGDKSQAAVFWAVLFLTVPVLFVAIYAPLFNTIFSRAFLPIIPMLLLGVFLLLASLTKRLSATGTVAIFVPVLAFLLISNLASYSAFAVGNRRYAKTWAEPIWPTRASMDKGVGEFLVDARYVPSYATHWYYIYSALKGKVNASERLLVLPITTMYSPGRRALQTRTYFGDDAVFRLDFPQQTIADIIREKNIRWVLFTTGQQRKVPTKVAFYQYNGEWSERVTVDLGRDYGLAGYSARMEFEQLHGFLQAANAVPYTPFPAGSFEQQVARLWRLP